MLRALQAVQPAAVGTVDVGEEGLSSSEGVRGGDESLGIDAPIKVSLKIDWLGRSSIDNLRAPRPRSIEPLRDEPLEEVLYRLVIDIVMDGDKR